MPKTPKVHHDKFEYPTYSGLCADGVKESFKRRGGSAPFTAGTNYFRVRAGGQTPTGRGGKESK